MAISTFSELSIAIASWLNRSDLTATIPTFIAMAEARFNRDVKHWRMEKTASLSFSGQFAGIPSDWVQTDTITASTANGPVFLAPMSSADMAQRRQAGADTSGAPAYFRMTAGQFEIFPTPDATYSGSINYISKLPALGDDTATNWILSYHPDAYLYTALTHSAPFLGEDERTAVWAALSKSAIDAINADGRRSQVSSGVKMRLKGMS